LLSTPKYRTVDYTVPAAPRLVAGPGETVYRIDPTRSQLTYRIAERVIGQTASHASGSTNGIAGDIALNIASPAASRVGRIVADVEELHSDNNLRDARIRQDFLESHADPLAVFATTALHGLPGSITPGVSYPFTIDGNLTVHRVTAPVSWQATGMLSGAEVHITATTTVKLSTFGIGPISIAGLVSTSDATDLTFDLVAADPSKVTVPTVIAAPASAPHTGTGPSFKNVVEPILATSCASCHTTGQVGAVHWTLDNAGDAAATADGLATVVRARYMPPWPASNVGVALAHSRALDQHSIDEIIAWADAGGHLDEPASTRITPTPGAGGPAPRHDETLTLPAPYTGSVTNLNDYRCFVLDPKFTTSTFITGFEVEPQQVAEIHHVQLFHIDAAQAAEGLARSGADGRPGWQCYSGPELGDSSAPTASAAQRLADMVGQPGLVAGWAPGQLPWVFPAGTGIRFAPGDAIVLQVHYHYDDSRPIVPDQSSVAIQTDPATPALRNVDIENPIAPVEIPCPSGATAPLCDRSAAVDAAAAAYGPAGRRTEAGLLLLCGETAAQLAAQSNGITATSSCDSTVPESGTILSVFGHEHTLGKTFRLTLDPGQADQQILLDIPNWNFDWQMIYQLAQPIHVTAGQTIRMTCTWDRTLDPNRAPKYIIFAEGTEDEMCFGTYAILPDHPD